MQIETVCLSTNLLIVYVEGLMKDQGFHKGVDDLKSLLRNELGLAINTKKQQEIKLDRQP